jgi:hypothetical protein
MAVNRKSSLPIPPLVNLQGYANARGAMTMLQSQSLLRKDSG